MKHTLKITLILLSMFFITQLIGLFVVKSYSPQQFSIYNETTGQYENVTVKKDLPLGLEPPETEPEISLISIIISMIIAIVLILLLMKIKATLFLRIWFLVVVIIALAITLNAFFSFIPLYSLVVALVISIPLSIYKIFKRNFLVHNFTELLIYPGIAAIFVSMLSIWSVVILLVLISVYDIYAVWHSGFMQKMAKFQINQLKLFAGFFVPVLGKKQKIELQKAKAKNLKNKKIKVNLAILGGGDIIFPIITAGVVLRTFNIFSALIISVFATLALLYLFTISIKGKFYPAMPYITAGLILGIVLVYVLNWLNIIV